MSRGGIDSSRLYSKDRRSPRVLCVCNTRWTRSPYVLPELPFDFVLNDDTEVVVEHFAFGKPQR
jgi:hypothetical protein